MATFSPAFLEEIRNRLSLSGVVGSRMRLIRAGREFKGCCPFHNEKTPSFYVNDDKQFFHCFGCGAHGDVIGFLMRNDRLSFPEAVEALAGQAGLQMPRDTPMERERFDREKHLYNLLEKTTAWFAEQLYAPAGKEGLAYLRGRGLSDEAIKRFHLGYAPADGHSLIRKMLQEGFKIEDLIDTGLAKKAEDRNEAYGFFRNRVIFPVGDRRGRTVAFGGRVIGEGEPKYLNSPDHVLFHKGHLLYGLSRARAALAQNQPIIVVEGYMDVISLVEAGYDGAVAPLGTALTEDQMQVLWKLLPSTENREPNRDYSPILCFDGDNAGLRAAARAVERALPLLSPERTFRIATITGAKDPDELIRKAGKSAYDAVLKQALPMIDMIWNLAVAGRQVRTPEEVGAFKTVLRQRVMQIQDVPLRQLYGQEFKKRLDDAFGWKPQQKSSGKSGGKGDWKNRKVQAPDPIVSRNAPPARRRLMEKILLALIINHPALFDDFEEQFARFDFQHPEFDELRQKIIEALSTEAVDAQTLRQSLQAGGEERIAPQESSGAVEEVLSAETYLRGKGCAPDADDETARQTWRETWAMHELDELKAELNAATQRYHDEQSDDNWQQVLALRAHLEAAQRGER